MNALRVTFVGGITSYRALFNWITPWVFIPQTLGYPIFETLFFAYLGRAAHAQNDRFYLIGNAFVTIAVVGMFGMSHATAGERRSQTLAPLLASPANRFAVFLGRALPSIVTGILVAATSFAVCSAILGVHTSGPELAKLALTALVASFSCTSLGLCIGALGLRGRSVSVFADVIAAFLLLISGANIPLHRLPGWVQAISYRLPITHGIQAARLIAADASLGHIQGLLLKEALVGAALLIVGLGLLRLFEWDGRRSASLETF